MSSKIRYFTTSTSSEWYATVKSYLDEVGIFDAVDITDSTNPLICKINNTTVFEFTANNVGFTFYDTNGNTIFTVSQGEFNNPCYVAKADNTVYISTNNGMSLREFIFGKDDDGNAWWVFWYSAQPTSESNKPKGAYFNAGLKYDFNYIDDTDPNYSQAMAVVLCSNGDGFIPVELLQFVKRQTNLPAIGGQSTPQCYRVTIDGQSFISSGQFLMPYTE